MPGVSNESRALLIAILKERTAIPSASFLSTKRPKMKARKNPYAS